MFYAATKKVFVKERLTKNETGYARIFRQSFTNLAGILSNPFALLTSMY